MDYNRAWKLMYPPDVSILGSSTPPPPPPAHDGALQGEKFIRLVILSSLRTGELDGPF